MRLSVVIPFYNEREVMPALLQRMAELELDCELILVDDGSDDGGGQIARELARPSAGAWPRPRAITW